MVYLDLHNYLRNTGTGCFNELLFQLMNKADCENYYKLANAFPEQAAAWSAFQENGVAWVEKQIAP